MQSDAEQIYRIHRAVRFSLPFHAQVAVMATGNRSLLDLEGRQTWEFPKVAGEASGAPDNGAGLVTALQGLEEKGAQFLLVPEMATPMMDRHPRLRQYAEGHRKVLEERGCCTIYALHNLEDDLYRDQLAPDGLPIPPPEMQALTTGDYRAERWLNGGKVVADDADAVLGHHDAAVEQFRSILDFGCGCGRIMRHWQRVKGARIRGVDYNPYLVEWCRGHLPFASFERAEADEPLPFDDDSFDFIFSFSVFTHLDREAQDQWMSELQRVAAPHAWLLITVQGDPYRDHLTEIERAAYDAGEMVIREEVLSGSSKCSVYHPDRYVRSTLCHGLDVVEIASGAVRIQDGVLLRNQA